MVEINDYKVEVECLYKGDIYSVRDNGAIMRHPKDGGRKRRLDCQWTFGKKDESTGYMLFASNVRVHQVVATAFWASHKKDGMVVDHKDTNRCNNRAENLHWVTKLENVLNNPITQKRITHICGSVEAFLSNPSLLSQSNADPNFKWMRTVSEAEAAHCMANLARWSAEDKERDNNMLGSGLGEWIFDAPRRQLKEVETYTRNSVPVPHPKHDNDFYESITTNAIQIDWKTPTEFLLCPQETISIEDYAGNLSKGAVFCSNQYGRQEVIDYALTGKGLIIETHSLGERIKPWSVVLVNVTDGKYAHKSEGTFFEERGAKEKFTLLQGKVWTEEHGIDFYC